MVKRHLNRFRAEITFPSHLGLYSKSGCNRFQAVGETIPKAIYEAAKHALAEIETKAR